MSWSLILGLGQQILACYQYCFSTLYFWQNLEVSRQSSLYFPTLHSFCSHVLPDSLDNMYFGKRKKKNICFVVFLSALLAIVYCQCVWKCAINIDKIVFFYLNEFLKFLFHEFYLKKLFKTLCINHFIIKKHFK